MRVALFLSMVFFAATIMCTALLVLSSYMKIVRIKRPADFIVGGIAGGILISFIFVVMQCNASQY